MAFWLGPCRRLWDRKILTGWTVALKETESCLCMVIWLTERCCAGLAPEIPEDLYCLIKKVSSPVALYSCI